MPRLRDGRREAACAQLRPIDALAMAAAKAEASFKLARAETELAKAPSSRVERAEREGSGGGKKVQAAEQALAKAKKKAEKPGDKYTPHAAQSLKAQEGPEDKSNADFQIYPDHQHRPAARARAVDRGRAESADRARARQSRLDAPLRRFARAGCQRLRPPLPAAVASGRARLARRRVHGARLELEASAPRHGPVAAVSPQFVECRRRRRDARRRSGQHLLLAHESAPARIAGRARFACCTSPAGSTCTRAARASIPTRKNRACAARSTSRRPPTSSTASSPPSTTATCSNATAGRRASCRSRRSRWPTASSRANARTRSRSAPKRSRTRISSSRRFSPLLGRAPTAEERDACLEGLAELAKLQSQPTARTHAVAPGADEP